MNRGRAAGRGTRRGAASTGRRAEGGDEMDVAVKEEPVSSATPSSFPAAASSSRTTRATTTAGRFRPRVIRRDETERDALAQQEQQKADERAADERRARGRGRFRSKRSRGDTMGSRGGFGRPVAGASGPFSGNLAAGGGMRPGGGGWSGGGGGGGVGGGGGGKFEPRGQGFGNGGAEGYREARINADKLHAMTQGEDLDSDDEAMIAALQARAGNVMPMGIYRREHKDTPVIVATTAELEAQENIVNGMQEDEEVVEEQGQDVGDNEEEKSLWVEGSGPPVVDADEDEDGSGDAAVGVKKEPMDDNMMAIDVEVRPEPAEQTEKGKRPVTKTKKKKTLAAQDAEESMIRTDLSLLASELGAVAITEDDGESKGEGAANSKDGRLYLFQFPPLLPPLKHVAAPGTKVKEEAGGLQTTAIAVDLTQGNDDDEEEEEEEHDEDEEEEEKRGFRSQLLSKGGMIGRLNVRKSGKVELDWGGQILEMSPAAGMNFLTTAVIVEESDDKPQNGVTTGESMGMGKIMGRFVLAPVWSEEAEWEVKPEELVVDEPV